MMRQVTIDEDDLKQIFQDHGFMYHFWKGVKKTALHLVVFALTFGLFYAALNSEAYWKRMVFMLVPNKTQANIITPPLEKADYAPELRISKIGVQAPIILNITGEDTLENLKNGVTHFADTALPGQVGNTVIMGHSSDYPWSDGKYKSVFALLDRLNSGDLIEVPYKSQVYVYEVTGKKVITPTTLEVLRKTDQPTLTLITCYPVGSTKNRLVVTAKLVKGQPTGVQTIEPAIDSVPGAR